LKTHGWNGKRSAPRAMGRVVGPELDTGGESSMFSGCFAFPLILCVQSGLDGISVRFGDRFARLGSMG
jgi:hypothetical protein